MKSCLALIAITTLSSSLASASPASGPKVRVQQGELAGVANGGVAAFLGVPFAAPPIGANRWRAPQAPSAWAGVRSARAFGASCMQTSWVAAPPYTDEFLQRGPLSEDCLFLNVWSPASTSPLKPVLVYIHGGGFTGGSGNLHMFNGAKLASRGVVVVTINYRLGIFGYLAHPALTAEDPRHTSGNYGLEDQIAALKWVQRNIVQFGGDPNNVTVAGESAGAISVNCLIMSPDATGLFAKAIAFSGSGMGFPAPSLAQAEQRGTQIATSLGAKTTNQLRALSAKQVLAAAVDPPLGPADELRFAFWPVVDDVVLPGDPESRADRPRSTVPLLTGFNSDENSLMSVKTRADLQRYVSDWFGARADSILALYPHATDEQAQESARTLARDRYMTSLILWTDRRAQMSGQTIYRYIYNHPSPVASGPSYGAFHTAEMPYVFGNLDRAFRPYGAKDLAVSRQLQAYLLGYMRHGRPDAAKLPAWPKMRAGAGVVMTLGSNPGARMAVSTPARLNALRAFAQAGGQLIIF